MTTRIYLSIPVNEIHKLTLDNRQGMENKYRGTALCISRTSSSRVEATKMNLSSTSSSVSTRKFGYGIDDSMADPSNYHLLHQMCLRQYQALVAVTATFITKTAQLFQISR
jgi:hypothetical protein